MCLDFLLNKFHNTAEKDKEGVFLLIMEVITQISENYIKDKYYTQKSNNIQQLFEKLVGNENNLMLLLRYDIKVK